MKCPLHKNIEMKEKRELVPFMHMAASDDDSPKRQWRISAHCPVPGCIQVGLVETLHQPVKLSTSMELTH